YRALRRRAVAADVAVVAHLGALRVRGPLGARRAGARRGVALALGLRALRKERRRRDSFAAARRAAVHGPARARRLRPATPPLRPRLRVAASPRHGVGTGRTPGLSRRLGRTNEYAHCNTRRAARTVAHRKTGDPVLA